MTIRRLTLALALGAVLAPAAAHAQNEDGVFVDPDSPSTREYSIPSEQARDQADPGRDDRVPSGGPSGSPAFGAGVGEDGGDSDGGGSNAGGGSSDGGGSGGGSNDVVPQPADASGLDEDAERVLSAAGSQPVPDGGGGAVLAILGAAVLVVLAGVGTGALLRRRRRT